MVNYKKSPTFIKIIANEKQVLAINPNQLASFHIQKDTIRIRAKAGLGRKPVNEDDYVRVQTDVIKLYYPSGTVLTYYVGEQITQEEFNYITTALIEWLFLLRPELDMQRKEEQDRKVKEWNDTMASPDIDAVETATPEETP